MARKLSKSIEEYLDAEGWSSHLFLEHAKFVFNNLSSILEFKVGRTVIYLSNGPKMIKAYVHHAGRTKDFMTFVDSSGTELETFHHSVSPQEVAIAVRKYLGV